MEFFDYQAAKKAGKSDADIVNFLKQQKAAGRDLKVRESDYNGTAPATQTPAAPAQAQSEQPGFFKGLAQDIVRPFARAGLSAVQPIVATGKLLAGDVEGANKALGPQNLPFLGETKPVDIAHPVDLVGNAAEIASTLAVPGAARAEGAALKQGIWQAAKTGAKEAFVLGATGGAGRAMQAENPTVGGVAKAGLISGLVSAPVGGLLGGAGTALSRAGAAKVIAPFAGSVDTAAQDAFKQAGIDVPASAVTKSRVAQTVESLGTKSIFGGNVAEEKLANASNKISQIADDLVRNTSETSDASVVGKNIIDGMAKTKSEWMKVKNALYDSAKFPAAKDVAGQVYIKPQETLSVLDQIIQSKMDAGPVGAADAKAFQTIKDSILKTGKKTNKQLTATEARSILQTLNQQVFPINTAVQTGDSAAISRVSATLDNELTAAIKQQRPDLAKALETADAHYKAGLDKLNSVFGQKIVNLKDQPAKIVDAIITPKSVDLIPQIYDVVGPETVPQIQAAFMEKAFTGARGTDGMISGPKLSAFIKKYGDSTVKAVLGDEKYAVMKNIETMSNAMSRGNKIAGGSQTAYIVRLMAALSQILNPVTAAKMLLGDYLGSKFINSAAGQKLLLEGVSMPGAVSQGLLRTGGLLNKAAAPTGRAVPLLLQPGQQGKENISP